MKVIITESDKFCEEYNEPYPETQKELLPYDTFCPYCGEKAVYIVKGCSDFYQGEKLFCIKCKKFSHDPKEDFYNNRRK